MSFACSLIVRSEVRNKCLQMDHDVLVFEFDE